MPLGTAMTSTNPAVWPSARHSTAFRVVDSDAGHPTDAGHRAGAADTSTSDPAGTAGTGDPAGVTPAGATEHGRLRKGEASKQRGERTRATIAQAVIDLLGESENPPTAKEIAARAGVSVRLVFHHFEDLDALYGAVARAQIERHWRAIRPVPPDLPLSKRIDRTVAQRAALFDAISQVRRRAVVLAARHRAVAEGLDETNTMLRTWLEVTFAEELRAAGHDRRELGAALEAVGSWEMWERLRHVQGLPSATARRVVARMLTSVLER
jgi:AcrR family transcriptional regulator